MSTHSFEILATTLFVLAILHTFLVKQFSNLAHRFPQGSVGENFFHLLSEVEVVFGLWAGIYVACLSFFDSSNRAISYLESLNMTEPIFVFVIMVMASTKPVLELAESLLFTVTKILPMPKAVGFFFSVMIFGPLLGSFITEPAAMTVTALTLSQYFYSQKISQKLSYAILGLLLVNVSIGGVLTPFAAPPVVMVAAKWNWDLMFMLTHFGWKAFIAVVLSTSLVGLFFRKEISKFKIEKKSQGAMKTPLWVKLTHVLFLYAVVKSAHHPHLFVGFFMFFMGFVTATKEYQLALKIREGLLVGFFLAGLVVIGSMQAWWLKPLLEQLSNLQMYLGGIALTAVTDNAALTYLASLVTDLSDEAKYAIVAGAVVGGGLTVIANAPNPIAFGVLNKHFGKDGISPLGLFKAALLPTAIAALCFYLG